MPRKSYYKKRKYYKKRRFYKPRRVYKKMQYSKKQRKYKSNKLEAGMPVKLFTTLKTVSNEIKVAPAAAVYALSIKLNDIKDPFGAFDTAQPYNYTRFNSFYNRYYIYSGMVDIRFVNQTANPVRVAAYVTDDTATPTSYRQVSEQFNARFQLIRSGDNEGKMIRKIPYKVKRFLPKYNANDLTAAFSASPTTVLYLHIYMESVDHTTNENLLGIFNIVLYQNAMLYDYIRGTSDDDAVDLLDQKIQIEDVPFNEKEQEELLNVNKELEKELEKEEEDIIIKNRIKELEKELSTLRAP